jgi:hypothetical protein
MEKKLTDLSLEVEKQEGSSVSGEFISNTLMDVTSSEMKSIIGRAIGEIIGQNLNVMQEISLSTGIANVKSEGIEKRYTEVEHQYVLAVVQNRSPHGIIEHVCSWFGKKYKSVGYEKHTKVEKILSGTNIEDVLEGLIPQIEDYVRGTVKDNMDNIAATYFSPQEQFVNEIRNSVGNLSSYLDDLRKKWLES